MVMQNTLLQVLRGEITAEKLEPDSPPCYPWDLLTPEEVARLRGCEVKTVYHWRSPKVGRLHGPPGRPVMVYGRSVLREMGCPGQPAPALAPAQELATPVVVTPPEPKAKRA